MTLPIPSSLQGKPEAVIPPDTPVIHIATHLNSFHQWIVGTQVPNGPVKCHRSPQGCNVRVFLLELADCQRRFPLQRDYNLGTFGLSMVLGVKHMAVQMGLDLSKLRLYGEDTEEYAHVFAVTKAVAQMSPKQVPVREAA